MSSGKRAQVLASAAAITQVAALVLAGLAAEGETIVSPGYYINRGHSSVAARLTALGADIVEEPA